MIPKTEIVYSWIYNKQWNNNLPFDKLLELFKTVKETGEKEFEPLYKKYINKILKLIPKFTGYKWEQTYIPIYLVKKTGFSFCPPLTLVIRKDAFVILINLIHELIHANFTAKKKVKMKEPNFLSRTLIDDMAVELITFKIIEKLGINADYLKSVRRKIFKQKVKKILGYDKKLKPLPINLDRETIKSSCLNNLLLIDLSEK